MVVFPLSSEFSAVYFFGNKQLDAELAYHHFSASCFVESGDLEWRFIITLLFSDFQ